MNPYESFISLKNRKINIAHVLEIRIKETSILIAYVGGINSEIFYNPETEEEQFIEDCQYINQILNS